MVAHGTVEARPSNNGASVYDRRFARMASTGTLPPPQPHTLLWTKVSDTFASGDTYPQGLDPEVGTRCLTPQPAMPGVCSGVCTCDEGTPPLGHFTSSPAQLVFTSGFSFMASARDPFRD